LIFLELVILENKMVKLIYIAPSYLPSNHANGIHVINQCSAINTENETVHLITCRRIFNRNSHYDLLVKRYGIDTVSNIDKIVAPYYPFNVASTLFIAIYSFFYIFFYRYKSCILSRNLYASFFSLIFKNNKIIYETHQLEKGLRKKIQKLLIKSKKIKLILISRELKKYLESYHDHKIKNSLILHDAAPEGIEIISDQEKKRILSQKKISYNNFETINGYFGQLYEGRGIEMIIEIASSLPSDLFLIFGGNREEIKFWKESNKLKNLKFMGTLSHPEALIMMRSMDILLMPYQEKVSIGQKGHDTAAWMSPMKMFEYMSSNSAIISSDHKVLKEVLSHEVNALIYKKDKCSDWVNGIKRLKSENGLMKKIKENSYRDYKNLYTWNIRGKKILNLIKSN